MNAGVTFTVFGAPSTKGSVVAFLDKRGKLVTKADTRGLAAWTQAVGWAARTVRMPLATRHTAVEVSAIFQFVRPASAKRRHDPTVKPDLDKTARALLDALTGVAYVDDAQVTALHVLKIYGPDARTTVTVTQVW